MSLQDLSARFDLRAFLKSRYPNPKDILASGSEWQIDHKECGDSHKHLWINVEKRKGWCYKCDTAYKDSFAVVKYVDECSFVDAIAVVRNSLPRVSSLSVIRKRLEALDSFEDDGEGVDHPLTPIALPTGFRACSEEAPEDWPEYIERRIGSQRLAVKHDLGWCWMGKFINRLIIPIKLDGKVMSFAARKMRDRRPDEEEWRPYLYPKKENEGQAGTGQLLFNYDRARHKKRVVLTEGSLDSIHGGDEYMAILGKSLSKAQLALLLASEAEEIVLMLDGDGPGLEAVYGKSAGTDPRTGKWKAAKPGIAKTLAPLFRVKVVKLPDGKDPDEFPRAFLRDLVSRAPLFTPAKSFRDRVRRALI